MKQLQRVRNGGLERWIVAMTRLVVAVVIGTVSLSAAAVDYRDLAVTVQSPPTGNSAHGYVEYRVTVTNRSQTQTRDVELRLPDSTYGGGDHVRRLSRRVTVPPGTTTQVEMMQPALRMQGTGMAVYIDGSKQQNLVPLAYADHAGGHSHWSGTGSVSLLLSRSITGDDRDAFETLTMSINGGTSSRSYGHSQMVTLIRAETDAADYSSNWLAYTRYDGLVLSESDMRSLPAEARDAIWRYVSAGGTLLVVGELAIPEPWTDNTNTLADVTGSLGAKVGFGSAWSVRPGSIAQWDDSDFRRIYNDVWQPAARPWTETFDVERANNTLPVIDNIAIPVRGMLALMVFFALLIGPVNLFVLSRMNRRIWMLVTVPVVSAIFSLAVFGYSAFSEGFSAIGRTSVVTILDEKAQRATSLGMIGYYAPLTPRGGLMFDMDTEVTALDVDPWGNGGGGRYIDWTNGQHLSAGWVSARVPAHFRVRRSTPQRERIVFSRDEAGQLTAVNGLGAAIGTLHVADENGVVYAAENVPAGERVTLTDTGLKAADIVGQASFSFVYTSTNWLASEVSAAPSTIANQMPANSYVARLDAAPFIEPGMASLKSWRAESVVYGIAASRIPGGVTRAD